MTNRESQLHQFGKMCFQDAQGKIIQLPASVSPLFDPPKTFHVSRVDFEQPIPHAGYTGRRPDVVLTNPAGHKLIVEIKATNGKGADYQADMHNVGMSLALQVDVSKWDSQRELRPDFTQGNPLQTVVNQSIWLSAGVPRTMEWRPYALALGECPGTERHCFCTQWSGGYAYFTPEHRYRLVCLGPTANAPTLASELRTEVDDIRATVYRKLATSEIACHREKPLTDCGLLSREVGWALHRDGALLPQYRIRKKATGYQAVVYDCAFVAGEFQHSPVPVQDFMDKQANNPFVMRDTWQAAVNDLFKRLVPMAEPLTSFANDYWEPERQPTFVGC